MKQLSAAKVVPTLASLLTITIGIAALNDDVRGYVRRLLHGTAGSDTRELTGHLSEAGMAIYQAVRDQSIEHAPLTIFVIAAGVLVFFMLRT